MKMITQIKNHKSSLTEKNSKLIALDLADKLKIPYSLEKPNLKTDGFVWNGRTFKFGKLTSSNIVHEIAHYLVANPKYKHLPEFGLGSSADGSSSISVTNVDNQCEEELASVLGILIEYHLKLPAQETLKEHSWLNEAHCLLFPKIVTKLRRLKIIDSENCPICLK